jgi:hypothetical protein
MTRIEIEANNKGAMGEALILGATPVPEPIVDELFGFLSEVYDVGENPGPNARVSRDEYFSATDQGGEQQVWYADGRISISWSSPGEQQEVENPWTARNDSKAVFPVDVKTGPHASLERNQRKLIRAIGKAANNVFPIIIRVTIDELPRAFDANIKIFGRDFD